MRRATVAPQPATESRLKAMAAAILRADSEDPSWCDELVWTTKKLPNPDRLRLQEMINSGESSR